MIQLLHSYESYDGTKFSSKTEMVDSLNLIEGQRLNGMVLMQIRNHVLGYTILWKDMKDGVLDIKDKSFILKYKVLPVDVNEYLLMKEGMNLKQLSDLNKYYNEYKNKKNELKH